VGVEGSADTGSTATKIIDAALAQKDKYWNGNFLYWIDTQTSSYINAFTANDHSLLLEKSVGETPTAGDKYEIHSIWNAEDIHDSINRAIKSSRQSFFISHVDENKCRAEDIQQYDISGLSVVPWILNKIYQEVPRNPIRFVAASAAATSITAPAGVDLTSVVAGWIVTVYDGTGAGQVKTVSAVAGQQISTGVVAWTTTPDTTSKVMVFDPNLSSWYPMHNFHTDALEYPQYVRFSNRRPDYDGGRFRFEYLGVSSALSTEASTTSIPEEYLVNKVCSILHGQVLNGTKADKEAHYAEFKRYQEEADAFLIRNAPHAPSIFLKNPDGRVNGFSAVREDPLGWND
jgi:hypothetical protein